MQDVLSKVLPMFDGVFLDIGANLGQTLMYLRSTNIDCRYVGFEPNIYCSVFVKKLIEINNINDATIFPVGCAKDYSIELLYSYQDSNYDASASMIKGFRANQKTFGQSFVVVAPIDECIAAAQVNAIGIVKIDVEGYEANIVDALQSRIVLDRPCIIIEILPIYSADNELRLKNTIFIEEFFQKHSYEIFRIIKNQNGRLDRFAPISNIGIHDNIELSDYLICPKERLNITM